MKAQTLIVLKPGDIITIIFDGKPYDAKIL